MGRSIAQKFADQGATVLINDEGTDKGYSMEVEDFEYYPANLTILESIETLFDHISNDLDQLDVLINNVGGKGESGSIRNTTSDNGGFEMDISLKSHWLCSKYAVEEIMDTGVIINNSLVHSEIAVEDRFPYNISKSAVNMQ